MENLEFRFYLELLPILLAILTALACSIRATLEKGRLRYFFIISTVASILLIVAQTSWWNSIVFDSAALGGFIDDNFANYIWTLFNTLVMISYLISAVDSSKFSKVLRKRLE